MGRAGIRAYLASSSLLFLLLSGCLAPPKAALNPIQEPSIVPSCIRACQSALASAQDLSLGPCLLNPMPKNPDWVCDVAHAPRQPVDNRPENQCSAYAVGQAGHFVEVSPECQLIRSN